jgi:hypothetical protein
VNLVYIGQTGRPRSVKCNALWTKGKTLSQKIAATPAISSFNRTSRLEIRVTITYAIRPVSVCVPGKNEHFLLVLNLLIIFKLKLLLDLKL